MAIARVSGKALAENLERTANLAIDTNVFYVDVTNNRVGIGTITPSQPLDVIGNANIANLSISGNSITSESTLDLTGSGVNLGANGAVTLTGGTSGQVLSTDGSAKLLAGLTVQMLVHCLVTQYKLERQLMAILQETLLMMVGQQLQL